MKEKVEKTIIIAPCYNESGNIFSLAKSIRKNRSLEKVDLLFINDGSTDDSLNEIKKTSEELPGVYLAKHDFNRGFASAIRTGINFALKNNYRNCVFMDCDQTHHPKDIPDLLKKIEDGYDLVVASRFVPGGRMIGVPVFRQIISRMGNIFLRCFFRLPINDATSGFKAIRTTILEKINLEENSFAIQIEEIIKANKISAKMTEIPTVLTNRKIGNSKMNYNLNLFVRYFKTIRRLSNLR